MCHYLARVLLDAYKTINKMIKRYKDIGCDLLLGVTQSHHIPNFNIVNMNNSGKIELNNSHDKQIFEGRMHIIVII